MKKFLYNTLLFTALSYAVQWVMDRLVPLDGGPAEAPQLDLATLMNPDALLSNPAALDALQAQTQSLLDPAAFTRMIWVTVITCGLLAIWPFYRFVHNRFVLPLRGLRWDKTRNFLQITDRHDPVDNPLLSSSGAFPVKRFVYTGRNAGAHPMTGVGGYIRSDKTKEVYPLRLHGRPTAQNDIIPPRSAFIIDSDLPPLTTKNFVKQFDSFTLVFHYNGHTYTEAFTLERVLLLLKRREKELRR